MACRMEYLTREDLLDLHAYIVMRYGGLMGIKSQDRLTTALHAPHQAMFGAELYPDVYSKAAALAYFIIKNHPFVSGNDGTALIAMMRFLQINGLQLRPDIGTGELIWLIRALNHSDISREGLEHWLRENAMGTA
jgi:death-on-curing protein